MTARDLVIGAAVIVAAGGAAFLLTRGAPPTPPAPPVVAPGAAHASTSPRSAAALPLDPDQDIVRTADIMGTVVTIKVHAEDPRPAEVAIQAAFDELRHIDDLMSTWKPTSTVSRLNAEAGLAPVHLDPDTLAVLEASLRISRLTGGMFDPTVGVYRGVWKFDQDNDGTIPDFARVRALLPLVSWHDLHVDPARSTAMLARKGQKITLGGIAKGYSVDRAVAVLYQHGMVDFVVQAGGDMYVAGRHGDRPWRIGIRDPRGPEGSYFAWMDLQDETFSTSGDYERFVIKNGKRWHHILDPRTGFPATACRSVTVVAHDATTADGISKGLFILGPVGGQKILDAAGAVGAVWVTSDNRVVISPALRGRVHIDHPPTDGL